MDPLTGAIGLVRNNTISICRGLEDVEHIIYGSVEEKNKYIGHGLDTSGYEPDRGILFEFLQCVRNVSQQLGKASPTLFYELLVRTPQISSEEVVPRFLKILESGYSSSAGSMLISELGVDTAWDKELSNHRNHRKFSTNMFLSLHALCRKASSWNKVLDVVESHLKFLVPHKVVLNLDAEAVFHINDSAIVQSTSQIARVMFESVLDVLMLLSYMTSISGQTQHGLHKSVKDRKVGEAVRYFFRAASMEGSSKALQSLPHEAGWLRIEFIEERNEEVEERAKRWDRYT